MHDMVEPSGSPGPRRQYVCVKPFIENAASAENCTAAETPCKKHETYPTARNGQIRKTPRISTVNPSRKCSARRTQARRPDRTLGDERAIHVVDRILHDKAPRDQRRGANRLHGVDSFLKPRPEGAASSSKIKSEPKLHAETHAMQRFARTIRQDLEAVRNAVLEPWSNGQTEGQINRLKTLKRAMYGRAGADLLRARILPLQEGSSHQK